MNLKPLKIGVVLALGVGSIGLAAQPGNAASLVDFEGLGLPNFGDIPTTYGDRLPGTPNITIGYRTVNASNGSTIANNLDFWNTGYGDLTNIAFPIRNGSLGEISLIPDAGFTVTLNSFNLGGYFYSDRANQTVRILDEAFNVILNYSPFNVEGNSGNSLFTPAITRAGTIRIQFGPSWDTGIDNINFHQGVVSTPIPTPALLPGLIGMGVAALRKRQQQEAESEA